MDQKLDIVPLASKIARVHLVECDRILARYQQNQTEQGLLGYNSIEEINTRDEATRG